MQICRRSNKSALEGTPRQEDTDAQTHKPVYDNLGMQTQNLRAFSFEGTPLCHLSSFHLKPFPLLPGSLSKQKADLFFFFPRMALHGHSPRDYPLIFLGLEKPLNLQDSTPFSCLFLRLFYPYHYY